jgi:hypothetical protein
MVLGEWVNVDKIFFRYIQKNRIFEAFFLCLPESLPRIVPYADIRRSEDQWEVHPVRKSRDLAIS